MADLPEGFVPHDGGKRPVPAQTPVTVMFRNGLTNGLFKANGWVWKYSASKDDYDIIAYRPTPKQEG